MTERDDQTSDSEFRVPCAVGVSIEMVACVLQ